ncbi:hypothetical protein [Sphingomonas mesophila]|uniref:hypothetical protein n=1 Tax=Sphingomonas mesophila TaxID=2303576 RepID=UPI000E5784F1|nr:hypothetical protein [Sphingomonas mesophila]
MKTLSWMLAAGAAVVAAPVDAAWHKASTKHFVIYADIPEAELRDYATKLEKFDAAARIVRSMPDPEPGDGNRVHVYVVPSLLDVNRTLGSADAGVGGYYMGTVNGPYIITPHKARQVLDYRRLPPETVFFHEYTHHLMLQNTNKPMPMWLTEGFAEFLANPIFNADGSVSLGTPANHRAGTLIKGRWAPLPDLLGGNMVTIGYAGFAHQNYAQGWLLNHYLAFEPSRKGQIDAYVKRIEAGENALTAAKAVFGDLGVLEGQLRAWLRQARLPSLRIDGSKLNVPPVNIAPMSDAASQIMMQRIYAKTGYGALSKKRVLDNVRSVATRASNDTYVMRTLAEVEYDNKNFAEAEKAADAALRADPKSTEAMMFKGRALLGRARKANDANLARDARNWFVKANKADKEDPEPLYLYYRSFRDIGQTPPASALEGLRYAAILAPRDFGLQVRLTREYLLQGKLAEAKEAIRPLAYLPHAGQGRQNDALQIFRAIEAGNAKEAQRLIDKDYKPDDDWALKL